jgi:hypothetical protein
VQLNDLRRDLVEGRDDFAGRGQIEIIIRTACAVLKRHRSGAGLLSLVHHDADDGTFAPEHAERAVLADERAGFPQ